MRLRTLLPGMVALVLTTGMVAAGCGGNDGAAPATTEDTTTVETTTETTTADATETTTTTTTAAPPMRRITLVVAGGTPQGGIKRPKVDKGDRVVLVVRSDVADEVHLHGYDISRDVAAGGTARLPFKATIPGRFEVELEERGLQLAEITVNP